MKFAISVLFIVLMLQGANAQSLFEYPAEGSHEGTGGGIRIGMPGQDAISITVTQTSTNTPNGYYLGNNYPNPFNPETYIYFSIPVNSNVRLIISDITGRELSTLVNEPLNTGIYKVRIDGTNLSSGTYFYKLSTLATDSRTGGNFVAVKRMVLIK